MLMPPFELHLPNSIDEACSIASSLMEAGEDFDWIAGGTDLIPNYKWHINTKPNVISLAKIPGIDTISMNEIGCMARLHDLAESDGCHPLVALAASKVASSLIRRNATLGGNLCLDTRCFWFNQTEDWRSSIDWCHKCDCNTGSDCRVIPNQNELCVATYQAGVAAAWKKNDRSTLRLATTALESIPRRHDEEVSQSNGDISQLSNAVFRVVKPVNNTSLPPRYRRNMVKVLIKRACKE